MTPDSRLLAGLAAVSPAKAAEKIRRALREAKSVVGAAKSLGVSRSLLGRLMTELGVSMERVVK